MRPLEIKQNLFKTQIYELNLGRAVGNIRGYGPLVVSTAAYFVSALSFTRKFKFAKISITNEI